MEDMNTTQFEKLWKYMHEQFQAIDERFTKIDSRFDRIDNRFDQVLGALDKDELEIGALGMKTDQHEERITRLEKSIS